MLQHWGMHKKDINKSDQMKVAWSLLESGRVKKDLNDPDPGFSQNDCKCKVLNSYPVPVLYRHCHVISLHSILLGIDTLKLCFPLFFYLLLVQPQALYTTVLYCLVYHC